MSDYRPWLWFDPDPNSTEMDYISCSGKAAELWEERFGKFQTEFIDRLVKETLKVKPRGPFPDLPLKTTEEFIIKCFWHEGYLRQFTEFKDLHLDQFQETGYFKTLVKETRQAFSSACCYAGDPRESFEGEYEDLVRRFVMTKSLWHEFKKQLVQEALKDFNLTWDDIKFKTWSEMPDVWARMVQQKMVAEDLVLGDPMRFVYYYTTGGKDIVWDLERPGGEFQVKENDNANL